MPEQIVDQLRALHTHAIDARNGYEEALEDAGTKGLSGLFQDMVSLHAGNADELSAELLRGGQKPNDEGSFMSSVHRTIMSIRSLFGGLGQSVLPGLIDGEERNASAYRDTLASPNIPEAVQILLTQQLARIEAAIGKMQRMREVGAP
jgi:uncharacterized protein (TIGR02284 family)